MELQFPDVWYIFEFEGGRYRTVTVFMGISVFLSCLLGVFMEGNNIRSIHE